MKIVHKSYYAGGFRARNAGKPTQTWPSLLVWAAAAYAQRINGSYVKEPEYKDDTLVRKPNKVLVSEALADVAVITPADADVGKQAREWHKKTLTFRALKTKLNDFEQLVSKVAEMETFDNTQRYELAITASQIQSFISSKSFTELMSRVDATAPALGQVGDKIRTSIEVTKVVYSQNYNVFFVTAITEHNQSVFFSYRASVPVGSRFLAQGSIKALRPDTTQLTRVKLI
jgi:hypothetical protein